MKSDTEDMKSPVVVHRSFLFSQALLRVLALVFTMVSIVVMVTATQTVVIFGFKITPRYTDSSATKFLVVADAVVCVSSFLSLTLVVYFSVTSKLKHSSHFFLFLHDMVMAILMIAGCAAATAIGHVARYGQPSSGWIGVCDKVNLFCKKATIAGAFSYCAFFCYFGLTILSVRKLMSPSSSFVNKGSGRQDGQPQT